MSEETPVLAFGAAFDTVAAHSAGSRILSLTSHHCADENPPHRHVNDYVCIVLGGSFAELHNRKWREWQTDSYFVHEAGETHHDRFGPKGAICLNLHCAPGEFQAGVMGSCSISAKIAANELALELSKCSSDDLTMTCLAAEIMHEIKPLSAEPRDSCSWIRAVVEAISDQPARRWSLRELAMIAGRHPVYLAQAFRARTGMSIGAFQRVRRLVSLSLALRTGRHSLAMLASDFGYCDQSHMNAEFRAAFGVSPGRFRRDLH